MIDAVRYDQDSTGDSASLEGRETPRGQESTASEPPGEELNDRAIACAIGQLVCSWGSLERATMDKLTALRTAAGDVRMVGSRSKPGMARLLAELRTLITMRDRHEKQGLVVLADIENHIQRITQFHLLVIEGFQAAEGDILYCRDAKNVERRVSIADLEKEIADIDEIKARIHAI